MVLDRVDVNEGGGDHVIIAERVLLCDGRAVVVGAPVRVEVRVEVAVSVGKAAISARCRGPSYL